jgi:hypothetical protein
VIVFVSFLLLLFVFDYTELCFLLASAFRFGLAFVGLALPCCVVMILLNDEMYPYYIPFDLGYGTAPGERC